ncbi:protoporphyrinogen oxidase [Amycolatopsis antarctica]|uniref:Coproporphyrinogen III oxidase n=1 Tax=Amycolatopsis antarctica TaxID=1854586 RepID=A0A263CYE1_9PSEU|nr:protoporphyrinogen oxidase [Amycolatopsis antarctica]OZM71173.1 protoporphyrinogen oxidase [Amycolatopsis antarctica]
MSRVAVVGGGVAGATAAHRVRTLLPDADITLVEASGVTGGKLRTAELAGRRVDVGAEAFLARRPEALALVRELGLDDALTHPTDAGATVLAGGRPGRMPAGTMMGVPGSAGAVAGLLSPEGHARVAAERDRGPVRLPPGDVSLGALLRERFGGELVDRLVDPLLGGVYAGGADGLGLRATMPALAGALDDGVPSLTEAAAGLLPGTPNPAPVFGTLTGGLGALVDRLLSRSRATVRTGVPVRAVHRIPGGWRLELGAAASSHAPPDAWLEADAVILAVPAPSARKLLADVAPGASAAFGEVELASMAVVSLALPPGTVLPDASGVLIGAGERRADGTPFTVKAFTYSARKWAHLGGAGEPPVLRGSVGRFGDPSGLHTDDDELVRRVRSDLAELAGVTARPVDVRVTRWGGGLPQYGVGHLDRVGRIERAVGDVAGLEVAGASLHGVGIPACIASGDAAARRLASGNR